ncbi:hypothetical protein [Pelosinus propionicus]|uniref:Uncharacterized protein n=1 Tax=Pelosinus propionicus DSM 13327 TaxID=1123291 RepID=A0A1I4QEP5_9FIRM|nr:hypothetical protein [Pelosinus propionicus]SFM38571.1 hypothetical protein SAMN04490355_10976 [Pelosinus propionicus DSM 13327]
MASVSFNTKGSRIYCKFTDSGFPTVHLGKTKADCIRMLQGTFKNRQYIEQGKHSHEKLDQLIDRINDNLKY